MTQPSVPTRFALDSAPAFLLSKIKKGKRGKPAASGSHRFSHMKHRCRKSLCSIHVSSVAWPFGRGPGACMSSVFTRGRYALMHNVHNLHNGLSHFSGGTSCSKKTCDATSRMGK